MRVRRSGGFAGLSRSGEADLGDASQPELRAFVDTLRTAATRGPGQARDTFVYHVSLDDGPELTVPEGALPADAKSRLDRTLT